MSTENFEVEVVLVCDRTGKEYKERMTITEAEDLKSKLSEKRDAAEQLKMNFSDIMRNVGSFPDLVVVYNGKVAILPHVSPKNHETLNRLLGDATGKTDMFPRAEPKKRKNSGKRDGEDTPT